MEILTRKVALELGFKTYYTGKPCTHGHLSYRYASSGSCADCIKSANGHAPSEKTEPTHASEGSLRVEAIQERNRQIAEAKIQIQVRKSAVRDMVNYSTYVRREDMTHVRHYLLFLAQSIHPCLQEEDIIRDDHIRSSQFFRFWMPYECSEAFRAETDRLEKVWRQPPQAPDFGILTQQVLKTWFQWFQADGYVEVIENIDADVEYVSEGVVRLGKHRYPRRDVYAVITGERPSLMPLASASGEEP